MRWPLLALGLLLPLVLVDERSWGLLRNTGLLAGAAAAASVAPGAVLAWLLARTDLPGRRTALVLLGGMLFVPLYLQAAAWQAGFGLQGWFTEAWHGPVLLEGWAGAVWVHAMAALPWITLLLAAGFRLVEPELEELALLDASPWRVFWRVTARSTLGALVAAALWTAIVAAGEMTVTDLFMVRTYAEEVYTSLAVGGSLEESSVDLLPGLLLTAWLVAAGLAVSTWLLPADRPPSFRRSRTLALGRLRWPAAILVAVVLLVLIGVPLGNLLYQAGAMVSQADGGRERTWSLVKALTMVAQGPARFGKEVRWSLLLGVLAATASVGLGGTMAWLARRGGLRGAIVLLVVAACLAVPGPLLGLATIRLLDRPGWPLLAWLYDRSIFAPWLVLTFRSLGPATLVLWHAMRTFPQATLDAAAVDGAGPVVRFWRIVVPGRRSAFALAWVIALAVTLGDLAASILVVPPGVSTLSIRIFGLMHYGVYDQVAGICLALAAVVALLAAAAQRFLP